MANYTIYALRSRYNSHEAAIIYFCGPPTAMANYTTYALRSWYNSHEAAIIIFITSTLPVLSMDGSSNDTKEPDVKKYLAWIFLALGAGLLLGYLLLLFHSTLSVLITLTLVLSVACNVIALNLFISKWQRRKRDND